jgi:hypothetical protein
MRQLSLGFRFPGEDPIEWMERAIREIERASLEDAMIVADSYTVSNFTESRSLSASTATTAQLANFVATFIYDLQRRSANRAE